MGRSEAQTTALVAKTMKSADSKSDGIRALLDAGMEVAEIKAATGLPYGFVYGVAKRHGAVTPTPRTAKAKPAAKAAKPAAKAAKPAPRAKAAAKPAAKTTRAAKSAK